MFCGEIYIDREFKKCAPPFPGSTDFYFWRENVLLHFPGPQISIFGGKMCSSIWWVPQTTIFGGKMCSSNWRVPQISTFGGKIVVTFFPRQAEAADRIQPSTKISLVRGMCDDVGDDCDACDAMRRSTAEPSEGVLVTMLLSG
jgi:hypothetical protein